MAFRISGLNPADFRHLYGLSDEELARHGARRHVVDAKPGVPDRIELRDLDLGETALLLNHMHQPADTPYQSAHAIFVREGAVEASIEIDTIPEVIRSRVISLRAFDAAGEMLDADLVDGRDMAVAVEQMFSHHATAYLHAHYAKRGCYAARIDRL